MGVARTRQTLSGASQPGDDVNVLAKRRQRIEAGSEFETGPDFEFTPCLNPLAPFRKDIHIITGLASPAERLPRPGNTHYPSMSALFSGHGATGPVAGA